MTNYQKFTLIQDNSSHWYIAPYEKRDEANEILDSIEEYWEKGDYEKDCPEEPEWLKRIDGPYNLSFSNPIEE